MTENNDPTAPYYLWSDIARAMLRCEPDETHDSIWDYRIEVAKSYPTALDAAIAKVSFFGINDKLFAPYVINSNQAKAKHREAEEASALRSRSR
jgi:hypothetical protein